MSNPNPAPAAAAVAVPPATENGKGKTNKQIGEYDLIAVYGYFIAPDNEVSVSGLQTQMKGLTLESDIPQVLIFSSLL